MRTPRSGSCCTHLKSPAGGRLHCTPWSLCLPSFRTGIRARSCREVSKGRQRSPCGRGRLSCRRQSRRRHRIVSRCRRSVRRRWPGSESFGGGSRNEWPSSRWPERHRGECCWVKRDRRESRRSERTRRQRWRDSCQELREVRSSTCEWRNRSGNACRSSRDEDRSPCWSVCGHAHRRGWRISSEIGTRGSDVIPEGHGGVGRRWFPCCTWLRECCPAGGKHIRDT